MYKPTKRQLKLNFNFKPIIRVANNSQEKFTILHVPHIGFLCYSGLIAEKLNAVCYPLFEKQTEICIAYS